MAVIYCPDCDSEIPENETICPSCGFDLATFDTEDDEFNDLLSAANDKLNEEAAEAPVAENRNISISQSQIDALLDGNVVDLTGLDAAVSKVVEKPEAEAAASASKADAPAVKEEEKPAAQAAPTKKQKVNC